MRLLALVIEYGVVDRSDWCIDAPSPRLLGYGDGAPRVDAAFVDFIVDATSVLDEVAVDVDPRPSFACAAWKRDTVLLSGMGFAGVGVSAGDSGRYSPGPGVGGGDLNATFLWMSAWVALPLLLLCVLWELRPVESLSTRAGAVDTPASETAERPWAPAGSGTIEPLGVGCAEDDWEDEDVGSSTGGSGRVASSGSGLCALVGVAVERGGHSGRCGSEGTFSLWTVSLSLSLSLRRPRLMRLKKAFMVLAGSLRRRAGRAWRGWWALSCATAAAATRTMMVVVVVWRRARASECGTGRARRAPTGSERLRD